MNEMQVLEKILQEIEDFKKQKFSTIHPIIVDEIGAWCCDKIAEIVRSHTEDVPDTNDGKNEPVSNPDKLDDGWIPVKERLPDEAENPVTRDFYEYEVTFQSDNVRDIRHYKYGRGHWWHGGQVVDEYVIAWRPKPEPYQPKEEK